MADKKKKEQEQPTQIQYVHIDQFLARKPDIPEHDKAGFRVYMRGRSYMHSFDDFEEALKEFYNRKR